MGNSNYVFYGDCKPLKNLTVTIDITEDLVISSDSIGLGFQLNAYSKEGYKVGWQQYIFEVPNSPSSPHVKWCVNNWAVDALSPHGYNLINVETPLRSLNSSITIPKGTRLVIALGNDASDNVVMLPFPGSARTNHFCRHRCLI